MSDAPVRTRAIVTGETTPVMPRHVKMRHDPGRGRWIILAPERVFNPDDIAVSVLKLCDGKTSVATISEQLAAEYQAPVDVITADVIAMLQDLADKGVIDAHHKT
jgi:pyrroloquinoline quinone biosynthesis protein D